MELAQTILPYREFSLEDLFANTAGVVLALLYLMARDKVKRSLIQTRLWYTWTRIYIRNHLWLNQLSPLQSLASL
ncbi:hypothetical protein HKBW3S25_00947 [Candidatus Hakubella thermalkaliphila]|uniref:VanZ-like domain-containing protein n=2 Tax=Candidatus Hakubella thermalkaliphila TaxID=2754717 RepID=A0A6V8NYY1_9ACTN|nr:hypothetical protein HKBW3S25_00947 [Candidatus Hakubella thermalkaliphila]